MFLSADGSARRTVLKGRDEAMKKMVDTVMVMALLMSSIPGLAEKAPADVLPLVAQDAGDELPRAEDEDMERDDTAYAACEGNRHE